jgi:hypothetical protein
MLAPMKQGLHDRLWRAQQRWFELRAQGETKRALKLRGLRDAQDANRYTRNLIFAGATRLSYERVLKGFVEFAHREHACQRLDDIGKREFRAFMDRAIEQGLAAKTLHRYRSAISKLAALCGWTASGSALSAKYGRKIRDLVKAGALAGPTRATPSPEVARRAIEIVRGRDARHFVRTDEPRAYHLVARLQLETGCRRISATTRATAESLLPDGKIILAAKGGRLQEFAISPELHRQLSLYLGTYAGSLADAEGYRVAYARAVKAAGGRVTGTHGLRRLSTQEFYSETYHAAIAAGMSPSAAAAAAKGDAVERLGHSRHRTDVARCYFNAA